MRGDECLGEHPGDHLGERAHVPRARRRTAAAAPGVAEPLPPLAGRPIVKPLPPEWFIDHGTNAEMRWEAMQGEGLHVPADRFFVRNHTATPLIDVRTWRLKLFGDGLHGAPARHRPVEFGYEDLLGMPAHSATAVIECAGNGRVLFAEQQGERPVDGTPWRLGGVGAAHWRGVRLSTVLERAGLTTSAVDLLPSGLDPHYVHDGVDHGPVRRPLPIAKALDDVLLAYEMNGHPLPPDHGFPVRLVVPGWIGIASIKWLGTIEVADRPLSSPWNTESYRLFGHGRPPEGRPMTEQVAKSAFELPWPAVLHAGRTVTLRGRSWSPAPIRRVDVSTDGGASWRPARLHRADRGWLRWESAWRPGRSGSATLMARVTDASGVVQPDRTAPNTFGYLFGAVARHPVQLI